MHIFVRLLRFFGRRLEPEVWDCGKVEIKQLCQQYTFNVSRDITKSLRDLEMEVVELQSSAESTGNPVYREELKVKKAVLADLLFQPKEDREILQGTMNFYSRLYQSEYTGDEKAFNSFCGRLLRGQRGHGSPSVQRASLCSTAEHAGRTGPRH